jgi:acyl carrier protein
MNDVRDRLLKCFSTNFPTHPSSTLAQADTTNIEEWDSVASVTLFALIEEEFGVELDVEALGQLTSFKTVLDYLEERVGDKTSTTRS